MLLTSWINLDFLARVLKKHLKLQQHTMLKRQLLESLGKIKKETLACTAFLIPVISVEMASSSKKLPQTDTG